MGFLGNGTVTVTVDRGGRCGKGDEGWGMGDGGMRGGCLGVRDGTGDEYREIGDGGWCALCIIGFGRSTLFFVRAMVYISL